MTKYLTPFGSSRSWPLGDMHNEMEQMLGDFFGDRALTRMASTSDIRTPAVDVSEDEKAFHVTAELPGVESDNIDVDLANNVLTIRAEKKDARKEDGKNYHRVERSYGSFQRQLALPSDVDADKAEVSFKQGVLNINLPKVTSEKVQKLSVKS